MYVKFINQNLIEEAPSCLQKNGKTIFNFNLDEQLMIQEGYKPLEIINESYDDFYQTLNFYYKESDDKIEQIYYTETKDLNEIKLSLSELIPQWYNERCQKLIPVDNFYVKVEWLNTYSTVYQALKFAEEEDMEIPKSEVIVATAPNIFENIMISSSEELKPLYKALILEYSEITPLRNDLLVKTQKATTLEQLLEIKNQLII